MSPTKPIVAVKSGRSSAGARAAASHTGALAASDKVVDALFRHAGVIRTNTLEELFDVAALLSHQPLPRGRRVAIVTDGRMSGASGKVPAAIHLTPEAAADGPISRLRDGDIMRLDARSGVLEVQVDAATLAAREPIKPDLDATYGVGRELFTRLREGATPADEGASIL